MRRSYFNQREPPMLTRQARGPRTTLKQLVEPLDRPMQPQNKEEEIERRSAITAFSIDLSRYKHRLAQTGASIKAAPAFTARAVAPGLEVG